MQAMEVEEEVWREDESEEREHNEMEASGPRCMLRGDPQRQNGKGHIEEAEGVVV